MQMSYSSLRSMLRSLVSRRNRAATLASLAVLGLGIGAITTVLGIVEPILLRPLPFRDSERIVSVRLQAASGPSLATMSDYLEWRARSTATEEITAFAYAPATVTRQGPAVRIPLIAVAANAMTFLGAAPVQGRLFRPDEDQAGAPGVVIISERFWERHLGQNQEVLGTTITLDGRPFEVVGVMPSGFRIPNSVPEVTKNEAEVWMPLAAFGIWKSLRPESHHVEVMGRLKAGTDLAAAEAQLAQIFASSRADRADTKEPETALKPRVEYLSTAIAGPTRGTLILLMIAAVIVLATATANTATLQLSRSLDQRQELALRSALGARPAQLAGQRVAESAVIVGAGLTLGLAVAIWSIPVLVRTTANYIPDVGQIGVNASILGIVGLIAVVITLLVAAAPSLQALRTRVGTSLKEDTRSSGPGVGMQRASGLLVVGQVALTLVLLTTATLLSKSLLSMVGSDRGYHADNVLVASLSIPRNRYLESEDQLEFVQRVQQAITEVPGVENAAVANGAPVVGGMSLHAQTAQAERRTAVWATSPEYFETLGMSVIRGRLPEPNERGVATLDEMAARLYFANEDPLDREIRWANGSDTISSRVIGVVGNVQEYGINTSDNTRAKRVEPHIYVGLEEGVWGPLRILVQSRSEPAVLLSAVRTAIAGVDSDVPVDLLSTMERLEDQALTRERILVGLVAGFAAVAFVIAFVGLYSVIAYATARRTNEFGIRVALGATNASIMRLTLRRGVALAIAGVVIGLMGVFAIRGAVRGLLFEIAPNDPTVIAGVAAVLLLTAVVASYGPARRSLRLDAVAALRSR